MYKPNVMSNSPTINILEKNEGALKMSKPNKTPRIY